MIPRGDGADVPAGSLPADMLYLILRHAARPADGSKGLYRDMVQLLCVCRHWRAAALPIVYRCLEITHGAEDVLRRMMNARGPVQMGPDAGPVTNAYFISGLGCLDLVRCVEISVIHISSPFSGLDSIFRVLQQLMDQWPEVRFLNINLRHMNNRFVGRPVNLHAFQSEASVVADKALKFINGSETVSDQIIAMYIRYLVLRLPTLRTLIAWNTPATPMMEFVDTFKQAYPHLGTIQYTLRQRA
ncbi:hypothetical protein GGF46_004213 [Coemansia sp. RSA 552]|nr:hypothetical protein GGF46_004213 [Coemansia sp. RSA 552]